MSQRTIAILVLLMQSAPLLAGPQQSNTPTAGAETFDVASIKRNMSGESNVSAGPTPTGYVGTNVPLRTLITQAFRMRPGQVTGGPDWINVDRFDVVARAPQGAAPASMLLRLRHLLHQRFKLVVHFETREQPVYALVRSRPDTPANPNLKASNLECLTPGTPANPCRMNGTIGSVAGSVKATGQTMVDFASYLANNVDRVVVDRTGLSGRFDFELAWTADDVRGLSIDAPPASNKPSLLTALQEQLGLKLEPARGPVEFLVIDSIEYPTPD
jgi:uncharacterized protein (TIGR03435 family)